MLDHIPDEVLEGIKDKTRRRRVRAPRDWIGTDASGCWRTFRAFADGAPPLIFDSSRAFLRAL